MEDTNPSTPVVETFAPAELLQGEALMADLAAKAKQAHDSADRVDNVLMQEFAAMEGISSKLRADYAYIMTLLSHARTKI